VGGFPGEGRTNKGCPRGGLWSAAQSRRERNVGRGERRGGREGLLVLRLEQTRTESTTRQRKGSGSRTNKMGPLRGGEPRRGSLAAQHCRSLGSGL